MRQEGREIMLTLNSDEKIWLDRFRSDLNERFPDLLQDIIVFGSKSRGDVHPDSDLDILVLLGSGDWKTKRQIRECGYESSIGTNVIPSILVYTMDEWDQRKKEESVFQEVVEREGVSVR